jgi:hypothetical protein
MANSHEETLSNDLPPLSPKLKDLFNKLLIEVSDKARWKQVCLTARIYGIRNSLPAEVLRSSQERVTLEQTLQNEFDLNELREMVKILGELWFQNLEQTSRFEKERFNFSTVMNNGYTGLSSNQLLSLLPDDILHFICRDYSEMTNLTQLLQQLAKYFINLPREERYTTFIERFCQYIATENMAEEEIEYLKDQLHKLTSSLEYDFLYPTTYTEG